MSQPEAFSHILIDKALEFSGWDLLNPQVQFELHTGNGRANYLLKDSLGRVLCVLEAKRESLDPYDAIEQARGYAENLKAPFIILSNGREHWFWNYERADQRDAYRIERLPSHEDLERVRLKNLQPPRPLARGQNNMGGLYTQGRGVPQDFVRAYMWFNVAASALSGDEGRAAMKNRDLVASQMTAEQIGKAQEMVRHCQQ
jgi:type I site-specific restriction endonuclease